MIMHLGGDFYVEAKKVLMILDYKEAARNKDTGLFLKGFPVRRVYLPGNAESAPKSVVITQGDGEKAAYFSPISRRTLSGRGAVRDALYRL